MFCDRCGAQISGPANFCPSCGRTFTGGASVPPVGDYRVARHVRTVGILWLVWAGFRLLESMAAHVFASFDWWSFERIPFFFPGFLRMIGGILLVTAILGGLAGWGLLERRPWARVLAIVLSIFALFKFPIGTALGIYTLWVLAPARSEAEYRSMQRAA